MDGQPAVTPTRQVADFVEAFEAAWARGLDPDLVEFLPAADHPLYAEVLAALVLIDLRRWYEQGRPRRLVEYQARLPALADLPTLQDLAAEEERLLREEARPPEAVDADTSVLSLSAQGRLEEVAL